MKHSHNSYTYTDTSLIFDEICIIFFFLKLNNFFSFKYDSSSSSSSLQSDSFTYRLFKIYLGDVKLKSTFNLYFSASVFPYSYLTLNNINKSIYESHGHCVPLRLMKLLCVFPSII